MKRRGMTPLCVRVCVFSRSAPGGFWREAEISLGGQVLVLELFAWRRAEPVAAVRQHPARTPPHPEGPTCKQPGVHQQAALQHNIIIIMSACGDSVAMVTGIAPCDIEP